MAVNLDDGAVDHRHFHIGLFRQGIENTLKDPCNTPIPEPPVNRVPLAKLTRKIAPLRPSPGDPEHGLEKQTGVTACPTGVCLLAQAVRFDLLPLSIRDDVAISRHPNLPFGKLESEFKALGNPDTQQTLERVALNRVHPIERNRNSPGLCWSWIAFYLNQIEGNTL